MEAANRAKSNFLYFLENVYTHDPHDDVTPFKKFPLDKQYLQEIAHHLVNERLLLIEKSRQMMITWICCAYCLWKAMFYQGQIVFIQSKKEKDADDLVSRCKIIYSRLPQVWKEAYRADEPMSYLNLRFGKQESYIRGTPQGADVLRQYTASLIFSDELAFQEKAEDAFIAAKPTLTGGGQFIGVSSPNFKNYFYKLVNDDLGK